ncbi:MAG TPA: hypothetical protein VLA24_09685 [Pseudomonadales bacterium]|nr:hypothetical protein [Pseudomonadales bacterium]
MPNGLVGTSRESAAAVIEKALVELSMKVLLWQVSSCVLVTAVSGVVGTVKFEVYSAVPLTSLAFDI